MSAPGRGTVRQTPMADAARGTRTGEPASLSAGIVRGVYTTPQAADYLGMSEAKFHEHRDDPWMPAPIYLGPRMIRWSKADLDAAIAAMPRQRQRSEEPAQLLRTRIERAKRTGDLQ